MEIICNTLLTGRKLFDVIDKEIEKEIRFRA